jgi:uncharacterized protein YhaN
VRSERARHERATQAAGALDTARGDLARAEQARIAAQGARVDAEGALRRIAAEEEAFRAQLDALGVPPRVSFDAGPAWLGMVLDRRRAGDELASLSLDLEATQVEARDAEEAARRVTEALGLTEPDALSAASSRVTRALGVERAFADAAREAARWTVDAERAERSALDAAAAAVVDPGVEDAWRQALASAGLPAIEGSSWRSLEPVVQRAIAEASALGERERELDAWDRGAVAWREEVAACCAAIGHPAPSDLAAARDVAASAQEARRSDALRASLRARLFADLEHAEGEVAKLEASRADLRAQLSALLERVGVPDPATLKARHAEAEDWGRARDAWHAAVAARDAALGDWIVDAGGFEGWSPERAEGWRIEADHAAREASEARARADACLQDITRLETALGTTKGSARVAELEADLASVRAELRGLRRELVEVALAIQLLRQTLQRFREAHQPRILQRAGEFLAIATDGVYVSIQASGDALEVRDAMGGVRGAAELSTGTAELLYLVLRLGLALELSAQHATLPLVLDDVLVNLDPERAEALARVLADVGRHQQLLVLSCRPETAELLRRVASAEVRSLPRFAGRSSPVVGVAPVASAAPTSGGLAPATSRVLEVLRTRAEPMSRREIQEAAGLPDDVCVAAIRELRQGGFIHQIGAARGARYGVGPG